jgi:hypothetical protein
VNWKNVLLLVGVEVKSYRTVRGSRFRRFRENRLLTYALYVVACIVGVLIGWAVGSFYSGLSDLSQKNLLLQGATYFFISLPTLALLYGLVFTQMSQIQRIGAKVSVQPLYWFPFSWEEHTVASVIANVLGAPLIITVFACSGILVASVFFGLFPLAVLTVLALLASIILASATTEAFKTLQVRLQGAVTRVAGRAAIWVRLVVSIVLSIVFYLVYFSLYSNVSPVALIESVAGGQKLLWFIPYLWPGMALSTFVSNLFVETVFFCGASLAFIYALFLAAVRLNVRFGLYEAPSIRVSGGVYVPRAGLLGRLGFSPLEAAILKKDFRAFTRRGELTFIFIFPVVFTIMPLVSAVREPLPSTFPYFLYAYLTLLPGALMTGILGSLIVGSEGGSVWWLYSSPVSARSLVKAKYSFVTIFSLAVTLICATVSGLITVPSVHIVALGLIEAVFLVLSLAMVSLTFGIKGADFRESLPRPRMIRTRWSLVSMIVCPVVGLAIFSPLIPYGLNLIFGSTELGLAMPVFTSAGYLYVAPLISGGIAAIITYVFRKMALDSAERLLVNAEGMEG